MKSEKTEIGTILPPKPVAPYLACRAKKEKAKEEWQQMVAEETMNDATAIDQAIKAYETVEEETEDRMHLLRIPVPAERVAADGCCKL